MKNIMKVTALVMCLILSLGSLVYAQEPVLISAPIDKDYEGHWAQATIEKWLNAGKVSGYPDGSYRPDEYVTRAEFVRMVNGIIDYNEKTGITYKDVTANDWFYDYISVAQNLGYISGYSAEGFGPNDNITREQAASIAARIQYLADNSAGIEKYTDKDEISEWAKEALGAASNAGFIGGYEDGSLRPLNFLTRAEALTMLDNILVNAKNIIVYNDKTELKDTVIEGDLIISHTVGEGDVHLTNVEVKGEIKVFGGGMNSIYFNNVKVAKIIVEKDKVRLVFDEGSGVEEIEVASEIVLENEDGTIAKITVTDDNKITLKGNFDEVTITGDANLVLDDAVITKLVVTQPIVLQGTGTIKALQANADGIKFEADVKIEKTELGENVTEEPEKIVEDVGGGGSPGGGPPSGDPTPTSYKISVSAVIDGTTYDPLFTTSTYDGKDNISLFIRDEVVDILNISDPDIGEYFTKLNNKIGNLKISGIPLNTLEGLTEIKNDLSGTEIVKGIDDNIFEDSKIDESEMKDILNAFVLDDLDKLSSINLTRTVEYGGIEVDPVLKVNDTVKTRAQMRNFMIEAGKLNINTFFTEHGTTVTFEITENERTVSFTIKRI